jgi:hypothetical protein
LGPLGIAFIPGGKWVVVDEKAPPEGVVHGILAFTFAAFLVTVALWPADPAAPEPIQAPIGEDHAHDLVGENIVGKSPYFGPVTAREVVDSCAPDRGAVAMPCYRERLKELLVGRGAIAAFDALDQLATVDPASSGQGHALAHDLGRLAFVAYGGIETALGNCSYKVFQGCFHGALEAYFGGIHALEPRHVDVCPPADPIKKSTCVHGIGHGLMLYTNANVNASLEACGWLPSTSDQSSCWSGVFMENLVGFFDSKSGHDHHHGDHTGPPGYIVESANDPYFPCSVLADRYKATCWVQMADYILFRNGSNFQDAAEKCDNAPAQYRPVCRQRIGTDASGWTRNVTRAVEVCGYGDPLWRGDCIRGIADEVVLYYFSAQHGIDACRQVPEQDKATCYRQVPAQGLPIEGRERMERICASAESAYVETCRAGAGLA